MSSYSIRQAIGLALIAGSLVAGCSSKDSTSFEGDNSSFGITRVPVSERKAAPVIEGDDLSGRAFSTKTFRGKTLVVNAWGSWCAPCRAEAPVLREVSSRYSADEVQFVGINIRDNTAAAAAFNRKFDIDYPSVDDNDATNVLAFRNSLPTQATPTTWIIDPSGRVAVRIVTDGLTSATLSGLIEDVLAEGVNSSP